ncbi:unnamed protein product [Pylaiella littoralis]
MGVDESNSPLSGGQGVVMGGGSFAVGLTSISQVPARRTRRENQALFRDADRRRSAPPSAGGRVPASAQTPLSSQEGEATRCGRKRRSEGDAHPKASQKVSKRGPKPPCGIKACGETGDWSNPCQSCESVSHAGQYLCFACHRPTKMNSGKARWRHSQETDPNEVASWWPKVHPDVRTPLRGDYTPSKHCVCSHSDCVAAAYDRYRENAGRSACIRCETCGTRTTHHWRTAGIRYGYHTFFASGKGATHRRDYLRVNGGELSMESDICNASWLFFRDNGGSDQRKVVRHTRLSVPDATDSTELETLHNKFLGQAREKMKARGDSQARRLRNA